MSFNTDLLIEMDEVTIETAKLIRKGMRSDKAIRQARIIIQERQNIIKNNLGEASESNMVL